MIFVVFGVLLVQVGISLIVLGVARDLARGQEETRRQRLADSTAILRVEYAVEALVRVAQSEADATRAHAGDQTQKLNARIDTLVEAMRTVVHETPDFAITGEDGEVPVRRMRGLRSALSRMEELSRVAAGE